MIIKLKICPQFVAQVIIAWATLSYYTNENQGKAHELVNNPILKASLQQHVGNTVWGTHNSDKNQ